LKTAAGLGALVRVDLPTTVTVTSTGPPGWPIVPGGVASTGAVAVTVESESKVTKVAGLPPKSTATDPLEKPVPVIVTVVPPEADPCEGARWVTVTAGALVRLVPPSTLQSDDARPG
jgi:hypothetical protein